MRRYIERNPQGDILGDYARPQPGRAEVTIEDTNPEFLAYRNPPPPDPVTTEDRADDLVRLLIAKGLITRAELDDAKRNRP